ncbi:hypothetical protein HDU76_005793, partial [Blyttiomyces sp. JEL0837]
MTSINIVINPKSTRDPRYNNNPKTKLWLACLRSIGITTNITITTLIKLSTCIALLVYLYDVVLRFDDLKSLATVVSSDLQTSALTSSALMDQTEDVSSGFAGRAHDDNDSRVDVSVKLNATNENVLAASSDTMNAESVSVQVPISTPSNSMDGEIKVDTEEQPNDEPPSIDEHQEPPT